MRLGWIALVVSGVLLVACGQTPPRPVAEISSPSPISTPSPTAHTTPTPMPSPSAFTCGIPHPLGDLCVGRAATLQEQQAMLNVGRPAIEAKYRLKPIATCRKGDTCFIVQSPLNAIVGTDAAVFSGSIGVYPEGGLGCGALVFLSQDSAGWHYVNSGCVQNGGFWPGTFDHVFVASGCANVRTTPSLSSKVVACLTANTEVHVDSAPVYADSHIWWHLAGRGWMAHDFLLAPNI